MWMHFVDFCIANSESSVETVRNADMWPCFTAPDNLINTYSNKERLKIFQVLSWCDSKDISREDLLQHSSLSSTWKNTNKIINHNNNYNGRGNNNNNNPLNKFNSTHRHTTTAVGDSSSVIKQHHYAVINPTTLHHTNNTALHHTNNTALHHTNNTTLHHPTYSTSMTDKNYVNVHSNITTTHFKGTSNPPSNPRDYSIPPPPPLPTLPHPSRIQGSSSSINNSKSLSITAKVFEPIAPHVRELPQTRMQQQHQHHSSFRDDEFSKMDVQQRIVDIPLDSMSLSVEEKVAADAFVDVYDNDDQYLISHEEESFDEDDDDDPSDVEHGCFDDSMHSQPMSMYSTSVLFSVSNNTHSSQYELY